MYARVAWIAAAAMTVGAVGRASAQPAPPSPDEPGPEQAITQRIGVWRIDALGIEAELVARLETLFRMELDRLAAKPLPTRRDIDRSVSGDLRECTGDAKCLSSIGKKIGVDVIVSGNVGALGDNYVLNVRAVDVATAKLIRNITSDPLRGSPDELIEAVRVAAYKLLAPDQLYGSIQVESDLVGATVKLDGKVAGKTPLRGPIAKQPLGTHVVRVETPGYVPFEETLDVRFQKTTRVLVRLVTQDGGDRPPVVVVKERDPWFSRWYVYAAVGVIAIGVGALIGSEFRLEKIDCMDDSDPCR